MKIDPIDVLRLSAMRVTIPTSGERAESNILFANLFRFLGVENGSPKTTVPKATEWNQVETISGTANKIDIS